MPFFRPLKSHFNPGLNQDQRWPKNYTWSGFGPAQARPLGRVLGPVASLKGVAVGPKADNLPTAIKNLPLGRFLPAEVDQRRALARLGRGRNKNHNLPRRLTLLRVILSHSEQKGLNLEKDRIFFARTCEKPHAVRLNPGPGPGKISRTRILDFSRILVQAHGGLSRGLGTGLLADPSEESRLKARFLGQKSRPWSLLQDPGQEPQRGPG